MTTTDDRAPKASRDFQGARRDLEMMVGQMMDRMGGIDSWPLVRILWARFRNMPASTPDPELVQARDAIAAELHRRTTRYDSGDLPEYARDNVHGELIGLRGALGIALGETVAGGNADAAGRAYYAQWVAWQEPATKTTAPNGERP